MKKNWFKENGWIIAISLSILLILTSTIAILESQRTEKRFFEGYKYAYENPDVCWNGIGKDCHYSIHHMDWGCTVPLEEVDCGDMFNDTPSQAEMRSCYSCPKGKEEK